MGCPSDSYFRAGAGVYGLSPCSLIFAVVLKLSFISPGFSGLFRDADADADADIRRLLLCWEDSGNVPDIGAVGGAVCRVAVKGRGVAGAGAALGADFFEPDSLT